MKELAAQFQFKILRDALNEVTHESTHFSPREIVCYLILVLVRIAATLHCSHIIIAIIIAARCKADKATHENTYSYE